jgi:hypothetical protein
LLIFWADMENIDENNHGPTSLEAALQTTRSLRRSEGPRWRYA